MSTATLDHDAAVDNLAGVVQHLGVLALNFGLVPRGTFHTDGVTPETDTTHTVMLGLVACALADHIGGLDVGLTAQIALVHDLPEVYAGDTHTLRLLTAEAKAAKKAREHDASVRIAREVGGQLPWVPLAIAHYDGALSREAHFVWGVDKVLPKATSATNAGATLRVAGVGRAEMVARYAVQRAEMVARCGEWPLLIGLYDWFVAAELDGLDS